MGGAQPGFGTPTFNPAQSLTFGSPWTAGSYGVQAPQQQLLHSLLQLVQIDYIQQQQLLQLVPHRLQLLQQIQQLIQVAGQQHQPYGSFPISAFGGPAGWLGGTQGIQPQVFGQPQFGGQAGYVM